MDAGLTGLLTVTIIATLVTIVNSSPGRWEALAASESVTVNLAEVGWYPYKRRSVVLVVSACEEAFLTLNTANAKEYIMYYLGYGGNTYAVVIPSVDCDSSGACSLNHFSFGQYLICNGFAGFWITWDVSGNTVLGNGTTVGTNPIVTISGKGLTSEAAYMDFVVKTAGGGQVFVWIDDEPEFLNPAPDGSTEVTVTETDTLNTVVYSLNVSDPEGDAVTILLLEDSDTYGISGTDLVNVAPLDYEQNSADHVLITIYDHKTYVNTTMTINIANVFDEVPNIDSTSVTIPEELIIGTYIDGGYDAGDIEKDDELTYSLSGTDASYFTMSADGRLQIAQKIDFDPPSSIASLNSVTLTVTDLGGNTNSTTLTFTISDVNDNVPQFDKALYAVDVTEGAGNVLLLTMTITDSDAGVNSQFDVTMAGDDATDPKFTFDGTTLELRVDADKIDYESLQMEDFMYKLTFSAVDRAVDFPAQTGTAVVVVKVSPANEHSPVWNPVPGDVTVSETTALGTVIDTYTATDDDMTEDGDVSYEIISITSDSGSDGSGTFVIDTKTGDMRVAQPLDFDASTGGTSSYTVVLQANDCCSKSAQATVVIALSPENDNPPEFTQQFYTADLAEGSSGSVAVAVADHDGDTLSNAVAGDGSSQFTFSGSQLGVTGTLDYESKQLYVLTITADDSVHQTETTVFINVTNVIDEVPVIRVNSPLTLLEEMPIGSPLADLFDVTDNDIDDILTYSLTGTGSSYFHINSTTGSMSLAVRVDREAGLTTIQDVVLNVADSVGNTATETLVFTIIDVNDNRPTFQSDVIYVNVTENTGSDTLLKSVIVSDDDDGNNGVITLSVKDGDDASPNNKFKLINLDLKTASTPIDYEAMTFSNHQYILTLEAVDQPGTGEARSAVATFVITVLPVNEAAPTWTPSPADTSVNETTPTGTVIGTYTATDDDVGKDSDVTYSITAVTDSNGNPGNDVFNMDSGNGEITLVKTLDYDTGSGGTSYYDVTVMATDNGDAPLSSQDTFRISVDPANDNPPKFPNSLYEYEVLEDSLMSTVIDTIMATDEDGDTITYTLMGDGSTKFTYTSSNALTVASNLDFEKTQDYVLFLMASDGVHTSQTMIYVNVTDVFDEAPVISLYPPNNIVEELPVGMHVGGIYAVTDDDAGDILTYSLQGTESAYFSINSSTGVISVAQRMDRDTGLMTLSQVTLAVTDMGGKVASTPLTFYILDINDNSPAFSSDVVYVEVTENTMQGHILTQLVCTDADSGSMTDVSITHGDDSPARFKLNSLALSTASEPTDYEDPSLLNHMYVLIITAQDSPAIGTPFNTTTTVVVKIKPENEFTPVFVSPTMSSVTLSETTTPGHLVEVFSATDDDGGDDGYVTYTITGVTDALGASAASMFKIDEMSGQLEVADDMDSDSATGGVAYYDIVVTATDNGTSTTKSSSKSFRVTLSNENDNSPVFKDFVHFVTVAEDASIGDVITTVTTADDDGDSVTIDITDGDTSYFALSGSDIKLDRALNYENTPGHFITISISDGIHELNRTLIINVTDVFDEKPVIETFYPLYVTEESPLGTVVDGLHRVTDLDRDDSLTFSLTGSDSTYFSINTTSGKLTVDKRIDLEALAGRSVLDKLVLSVVDMVGLSATSSLAVNVLDINDEYPTFSESLYRVNVSEGSITKLLVSLVATDADSGNNGNISMAIIDGDDPLSNKFVLSGTELSTHGSVIDYESLQDAEYRYVLTIEAKDNPLNEAPKTGITTVIVSVLPVNEHAPAWEASMLESGGQLPDLRMMENTTVGSELLTLKATDADHGQDGVVSYHILSITTNTGVSLPGLLTVDSVTGVVRVIQSLDYDIVLGSVHYVVEVAARDGGNAPLETKATFKIILDNVNDNPPVFLSSDYQVDVSEAVSPGTVIHTFASGSDLDGDAITYSVIGGNSHVFEISGTDVKTLLPLDFETERCYSLVIVATDGLYDVNITMTIKVTDVIDEAPVITVYNPLFIPEEQPLGTVIGWVFDVVDTDANDILQYTITGADVHFFSINSSTGQMSIKQRIDREVQSSLGDLTLRVEDSAALFDEAVLSFALTDVNDNAPTFSQDTYTFFVEEEGSEVDLATFAITDNDLGNNAAILLTISNGNSGGEFRLDGLTLKADTSKMDYESSSLRNFTYVISVLASDQPTEGLALTGQATVVIHVGPKNEFSPVWQNPVPTGGKFPDVTISESLLTTSISAYSASDDDKGDDGTVSYSIVTVTTAEGTAAADSFHIDSKDGSLWMTHDPDADLATGGTGFYDIDIRAEDGGSKSVSATQRVIVTNDNDNPPSIVASSTVVELSESVTVGTSVFKLDISDVDKDLITSSLTEGSSHFSFVGSHISLTHQLDYETERCQRIVVEASDGVYTVNITLFINITDENDNAPTVLAYAVDVLEEQPIDSTLGGVFEVTDKDEGDIFTFSLTGPHSSYIKVDTVSGVLKIKDRIDRDGSGGVVSLDDLTLAVTDKAGHTTTASLNITVLDLNDNVPVCTPKVIHVNITENTTDSVVAQLSCSDLDDGDNGKLNMSISGGDALGYFTLTGIDLLARSSVVDYESIDTSSPYTATITVEDSPQGEAAKSCFVTVIAKALPKNEFSPMWKTPTTDASGNFPTITLYENVTVGFEVMTFTATDDDAGPDGDIAYDVVSITDETGKDQSSLLYIGRTSGTLRTSQELDRDLATGGVEYLDITIRASDTGSVQQKTEGTVRITLTNVNDNAPTFNSLNPEVVVSETTTTGTSIYRLEAQDIDGDSVAFQMVDGDVSLVQMVGSDLELLVALDYETKQCQSIVFSATDSFHAINISVLIRVEDVIDETPTITLFPPYEITEELPIGTVLGGFISVDDLDAGDSLIYTISGSGSAFFKVNVSTGSLYLDKRVDRDGQTGVQYIDDVTLTVVDAVGLTASADFNFTIVDINDNVPICSISNNSAQIVENTTPGTVVTSVVCSDLDSNNYGNSQTTVDATSDPGGYFQLSGNQLLTGSNPVDYETTDSVFSVRLLTVDNPGGVIQLTSTSLITIKVQPVNEFSPVWTSPTVGGNGRFPDVSVSEKEPPGYPLVSVAAQDDDMGDDGELVYAISSVLSDTGTDESTKFFIDPSTGTLSTLGILDADAATGGVHYYDITLSVQDRGNPPKATTAIQRVVPQNYNDIEPVFSSSVYSVTVACDEVIGSSLMQLNAVDDDGPSLTFGVDGGSNVYVSVNGAGEVTLVSRPGGTLVNDLCQMVSVVVTDNGSPELKAKSNVNLLFENCQNMTTCDNSTNTTTTTTQSTTLTTTVPSSEAPCTCSNVTASPCINITAPPCANVTAQPCTDTISPEETWAMRIIIMTLAMALLGTVLYFCRPKVPPRPPSRKPQIHPILERGIGDDNVKPLDDLEYHYLHK